MLVLSRKVKEKITIGDDIVITISKISGGRVTIGIEAPKHVPIHRAELLANAARQQPSGCGGDSESASLHVAAKSA